MLLPYYLSVFVPLFVRFHFLFLFFSCLGTWFTRPRYWHKKDQSGICWWYSSLGKKRFLSHLWAVMCLGADVYGYMLPRMSSRGKTNHFWKCVWGFRHMMWKTWKWESSLKRHESLSCSVRHTEDAKACLVLYDTQKTLKPVLFCTTHRRH